MGSAPVIPSSLEPQPAVNDAIVFVQRASIRPVVRQELKSAGVANVHTVDTAAACEDQLARHPSAMLVVDWDHGARTVNQVLRAAQGVYKIDTRPIFLIAAEVSLDVVAIGTEYNVSRVHTGEISRGAMQEHIEYVVQEEADDSEFRAALTNVAEARARGDVAGAGDLLMELAKRWPDNRRITCELVDNLIQDERWDQAYAVLDRLSASDRHNLRVQHLKARCLMKQGHFEQASELLRQTQLINPYNVDRLVDLGNALMQTGKIRDALESFTQALDLDAGNEAARRGSMQCRLVSGDVNEAVKLVRQVSSARELASIFNNAAVLSIRQGRFDQGLALYRTAIGAVGEELRVQARLVFNLGIAFHKWGRLNEALECFEKAVAGDGSFSKAKHNAMALAAKLGRKAKVGVMSAGVQEVEIEDEEAFEDEKVGRT